MEDAEAFLFSLFLPTRDCHAMFAIINGDAVVLLQA